MIPQSTTKTLTAANATAVAAAQVVGAGANFTINGVSASGGVATFDTQRRVLVTSVGNDSAVNFTIRGSNDSGASIIETLAGGSASAVYTNLDFKKVTQVMASAATTTASVGTNGVGSTPWQSINMNVSPSNVGIGAVTSGTVNYTVQYTYEDPNNLPSGSTYPVPFGISALTLQTTNVDGSLSTPAWGIRAQINSGTGSLRLDWIQAGIAGP